jgi:hypothetical protein
MNKFEDNWLYAIHSKEDISCWVNNLNYFYFMRAYGGHANDYDRFVASFVYSDRDDLLKKLFEIKIDVFIIPDDFPRPIIGKSYPSVEFAKFKHEIKRFKDLEQPGERLVNGQKCFIWVAENSFDISVSGENYKLGNIEFESCKKIESLFDSISWRIFKNTEIEKSIQCAYKLNYPELFDK